MQEEELAKQNVRAIQMQNAKVQRIQHYHDMEQNTGPKGSDLTVHVKVNKTDSEPAQCCHH